MKRINAGGNIIWCSSGLSLGALWWARCCLGGLPLCPSHAHSSQLVGLSVLGPRRPYDALRPLCLTAAREPGELGWMYSPQLLRLQAPDEGLKRELLLNAIRGIAPMSVKVRVHGWCPQALALTSACCKLFLGILSEHPVAQMGAGGLAWSQASMLVLPR